MRICPECGGLLIPQLPHTYFPGWIGELPDIILGYSVMEESLQDTFITNWKCLPGDSMGVPTLSPSDLIAFDRENKLDSEDFDFIGGVLQDMSSGYRKGYSQAGDYKDLVRKQKKGVR